MRDTIWLGDMDQVGDNAEFDLDLDPTGNVSPPGLDIQEGTDGATDGLFNYTVESFVSDGVVTRYGLDWSGGENLFDVTGTQIVGITYDSANGTLWISDEFVIQEYDMAGRILSGFPHDAGRGSLAYESSTDTLWYVKRVGSDTLFQYDKSGNLLQVVVVGFGGNVWGAEFAFQACAADCNQDGDLDVLDFVCFQTEWASQTTAGDCDANGVYNVLDFVCFQQLFQAGCP